MSEMITIDGSQGEGGGQILRTSLSLSAIYGQPFEMVNVRANREKPGLKRQHLTCVRAVAEICGAKVAGDEVGSMRLTFEPGPIRGGTYRFDIGTAGSVTLVAQTVVPVLLRADAPSEVTITGGTHVPFAPVWEFFAETYLPELRTMGAEVEAEMEQCGFYPAAGGVIKLRIKPFDESMKHPYRLMELGAFKGGRVVGVVSGISRGIAEAEVGIIAGQFRDLGLQTEVREIAAFGPGNYCFAQLDYERASVVLSGVGTYNRSRKAVAHEVVSQMRDFLKAGKACEKHLADQLLAPLEVLVGCWWNPEDESFWNDWQLAVQRETEHYTTNQAVIAAFRRAEDH